MTKRQDITAIIKDKRGRILSIGKNSYSKTHPMMLLHGNKTGITHKETLHAEVAAIVRCKDLSKAKSIHVYRYSSKGQPLTAKPCPICQSAIDAAGIKMVYFTVTEKSTHKHD